MCYNLFGRETWVDLPVIDMVDFNVIMGIDLLAPNYVVLDCYVKIVNLSLLSVPRITLKGVHNLWP